MDATIGWASTTDVRAGVAERAFRVVRPAAAASVPGVLWQPSDSPSSSPLVLLGHGGSGHKRSTRIVSLARWFASQAGIAAVAIDGPYHGDRVRPTLTAEEYQSRMAADGIDGVTDNMVADWHAVLCTIGAVTTVDTTRVGYLGLSMGTRFGLPVAAALGESVRCAVFGKFGLEHAPGPLDALDMGSRLRTDAARITAPVLFHLQWDDELFPRCGQMDLFELLGSRQKQLIAYSGPHGSTEPSAIHAWRTFIAANLASTDLAAR